MRPRLSGSTEEPFFAESTSRSEAATGQAMGSAASLRVHTRVGYGPEELVLVAGWGKKSLES